MATATRRTTADPDGRLTLTVREVAELIGISLSGTYAALNSGEIPGRLRIGGRVLVSRAALQHWLDQVG
ncbi:helix-turn-helix domain-containing protein [Luteipulveratus halotolerans]|uniref:Helix-turn-helix domain-containing protein n=1 Tax=Luteipulveratus halotolerans TaxID=1631356 RepID=A0A0L6CEI7_9MICO|nr:helix-turn-helix domain-containing protein [Luteipulveratus halotolerans]KNX36094.1 hypothetical protein VV01_01300 [Luteipulveratus halotolerans]